MDAYFIWNGIDSRTLGVIVTRYPPIVYPTERAETTPIPGRPGFLTRTEGEGIYDGYIKTIEIGNKRWADPRAIAVWLRGPGELIIGNEPDSLFALNEIQRVAALMRFELERGNMDAFAQLMEYQWELALKIDAGSTNTLIDHIFQSIDDLIDGRMVCGAGGGGFLQIFLKEGVTKQAVHERLKEVFEDNDVDLWECTLV